MPADAKTQSPTGFPITHAVPEHDDDVVDLPEVGKMGPLALISRPPFGLRRGQRELHGSAIDLRRIIGFQISHHGTPSRGPARMSLRIYCSAHSQMTIIVYPDNGPHHPHCP